MKQLRRKLKVLLIVTLVGILALNTAVVVKSLFTKEEKPTQTVYTQEQISKSPEYIISEKAIYDSLQAESQIVSLQQGVHKKSIHVDDSPLGERHTELTMYGTLKMGLNTKDIQITRIDSNNGIIYMKLPKPTIISLELPYNQVDFDKTKGWARLPMKEGEKRSFYKAEERLLREEILQDKELLKQVDIFNRDAVTGILKLHPEVKDVIFE